jgi:hypothetical protein
VNHLASLRQAATVYALAFGVGIALGYGAAKAWIESLNV